MNQLQIAAVAPRSYVYFQIAQVDGISPANGEAGGQPQISVNSGAWTNTGIGVLNLIGNGRYYADLSAFLTTATAGQRVETRYKSNATSECPGDSVLVVAYDVSLDPLGRSVYGYPSGTEGAALSKLTSAQITVSPGTVSPDGSFEIVRGCDYFAVDGNSKDFTDNAGVWPDLTGATVVMIINSNPPQTFNLQIIVASGSGKTVRAEFSAAQTLTMNGGTFRNLATLANGHTVPLVESTCEAK